jgi:hypothetical protein
MIQLIFEYEPVVSDTSVSSVGSLGTVVMAANYNAAADNFASFAQMIEYGGAVRGRISDGIACGVEADPNKLVNDSRLYIRGGAVPTGQDVKTYDLAKFQIGLFGVPTAYTAGTQIGLLFCRYKVKLSKPKLYDNLGLAVMEDQFQGETSTTNSLPLGTAVLRHGRNTIGCVASESGTSTITFPDDFSGSVLIYVRMAGTSPVATITANTGAGNNMGGINHAAGAGPTDAQTQTNQSSTVSTRLSWYQIGIPTAAGANYITIASTGTAVSSCFVTILQVNPDLNSFTERSVAV